jgi:maleamate amidohydrolase
MGFRFLERDEKIPYIAEAMEVYKKAGIGSVWDLYKKGKRPAVIVVDLQEAFVSPDAIMGAKGLDQEVVQTINGAVKNTGILLEVAREKGSPIIYSAIAFREDGTDSGTWGERNPSLVEYCKRGTRWVEVDKRIAPQAGDYRIEKRTPSAFVGTPLHQILTYNRVDTCIVTGVSLSGCVRQTVVDAVSNAYYAVVPEECVGDRSIGPYKSAFFEIITKYADVAPLDDVLNWLNGLT